MEQIVIWDFDGTLAHRPHKWSGAILAAVRAAGVECTAGPADISPFLQDGFPWHRPDVVRPAGRGPEDWWADLTPVLVRAIRAVTEADAGTAERVARRVPGIYADPSTWALYPDTIAVLDSLRRSGWTQVVLSNHVPELSSILAGLGLSPFFGRTFNSAETGVEKPHPAAFRQVLDTMPTGGQVWMIGDSLAADVLPAEALGMHAILVRAEHPQAPRCCRSLTNALGVLTGGHV